MFTPKIGEDEPILTSIFFRWVGEKPPTSNGRVVVSGPPKSSERTACGRPKRRKDLLYNVLLLAPWGRICRCGKSQVFFCRWKKLSPRKNERMSPEKTLVGRCLSYWNSPFLGGHVSFFGGMGRSLLWRWSFLLFLTPWIQTPFGE